MRYLSDSRAVVQTESGPKIETSTVPLRIGYGGGPKRPVDLHLRSSGGGFAPINPLATVAVARDLAGGVLVGQEGLQVTLQGVDAPGALSGDQTVFYPHIATDTDAMATPTLRGVDLSALIRSPESPEQLRYRVRLPPGANLRTARGGAEIVRGGKSIASVTAPSATDAQGSAVPVRMTVAGDEMILTVPHRRRDLAYPILVDPEVLVALLTETPEAWAYSSEGTGPTHSFPSDGPISLGTEQTFGGYDDEPWERISGGHYDWTVPESAGTITSVEFLGVTGDTSAEGYVEETFPNEGVSPGFYVHAYARACGQDIGSTDYFHYHTHELDEKSSRRVFTHTDKPAFNCDVQPITVGVFASVSGGVEPGASIEEPTHTFKSATVSASVSVSAVILSEAMPPSDQRQQEEEELGLTNRGKPKQTRCFEARPVNCVTGNQVESQTDSSVGGRGPALGMTRTYNSKLAYKQVGHGPFGFGWTGSYSAHLTKNLRCPYAYCNTSVAAITQDDGSVIRFERSGPSSPWSPVAGSVQATLASAGSGYVYTLPDQSALQFDSSGQLTSETDRNGNVLTIHHDEEGRVDAITDPAERTLSFKYNAHDEVESVTDPMGHEVKYTYTEAGDLASVTEPGEASPRWQFGYDSSHRLTTQTDGRGHTTTTAYSGERVSEQTDPVGNVHEWTYSTTGTGPKTTLVEPNGAITVEQFNDVNMPVSVVHAWGTASASSMSFKYDEAGNLVEQTDANGHVTKYEYNAAGDRTSETNALGHTSKWTYNGAHEVTSTTTPKGETTTIERDGQGNAESISRPGPGETVQTTKFKYAPDGDLEQTTEAMGEVWKYEYDAYGDKTGEVAPGGEKRAWAYDEDSREIETVSPRGNVAGAEPAKFKTTIERDAQGRPIKVTRPEALAAGGSPPDPPADVAPPTVSGPAQVEQTLTASSGSWSGTSPIGYAYQWQSCDVLGSSCLDISGATSSSYVPSGSDVGDTLRVVVTASNVAGSAASTSEPTAAVVAALESGTGLTYASQFGTEGSEGGQFHGPGDVAIDAVGDLWVVDNGNDRLEKFSAGGEYLASVGGEGSEPGQLLSPSAIAIDSTGDLWVADTGNSRVDEYDQEGTFIKSVGAEGSPSPSEEVGPPEGIAIDGHDNVWVSATYQGRLVVFSHSGEYLKSLGSKGSEPGQIGEGEGIAIDPHGNIWVADFSNDRIDEFDEHGEFVRDVGTEGSGDGQFRLPYGIEADSAGNVWATDIIDDRVEEFNEAGEYVRQFGSEGSEPGYLSLGFPVGVAIDGSGAVWVTDSGNNRLEKWDEPTEAPPTSSTPPSVSGQPVAGQVLHASDGTWNGTPSSYSYQWESCSEAGEECHGIEGANASSYTLVGGDVGATVKVLVTATNAHGSTSAASPTTAVVEHQEAPVNLSAPTVSGTPEQGKSLSTSHGTWSGVPTPVYSVQWRRCDGSGSSCADISGATNSTYVVARADVGHTIRANVTATNVAGSLLGTSEQTTVVMGSSGSTTYAYDGNGNLEAKTDPYGHKATFTYDTNDHPTKVKAPNGTTEETEYDAEGLVVAQSDANNHVTKYERNLLEEVTKVTDPLARASTKEYDHIGNLKSVTDAAGRMTTYSYDAANQLTKISYSDGTTHSVVYEYDIDGERKAMKDGTGTTSYSYDQLDRLTEVKDGHGQDIGYKYDLGNRQVEMTYPNGEHASRAYDEDGRLESVSDWLGHTTHFAYDADSNLTRTTFPTSTGDVDEYGYDNADAMSEVKMNKGEEVLVSLGYTHNDDGQLAAATATGLPGESEVSNSYDASGRLTKAGATSYEYDPVGDATATGVGSYAYDHADELETGPSTGYSYDEVGERTEATPSSGPATTYDYDQPGNLTSVGRVAEGESPSLADGYTYDGTGLRAAETIAGTTSYLTWDVSSGLPLLADDGHNSYVYGPGGLPVEQIENSTGTVQYLHHDQQGSTRLLTGSAGTTQATFSYGPYGGLIESTGTATTPLGYDAQYTSPDNGLIYMWARTYDPTTAQFLSVDPAVAITREPYAYVGDNPLDRADPTGLCNAEPWTGSFWTDGNCLSGAVGGPNGGGSQPVWWDIPAYAAILIPCVAGGEALCASGLAASGAAQTRGSGSSGSAEGFSLCAFVGRVGDESGLPPNWQPPTNEPQSPPVDIPPGWRVRAMPPRAGYPNGYWRLEKPMTQGGWQGIDPSTGEPGTHPETHVPFPEGEG